MMSVLEWEVISLDYYSVCNVEHYRIDPVLDLATDCRLGIGWWIFIDAVAYAKFRDFQIPIDFVKTLPGIGTTLAFFGINSMDWGAVTADALTYHGDNVACKARTFVVFCLVLSMSSVVGSIVILANVYVDNEFEESVYPGTAIFAQAVLIFIATFFMKLLTAQET